ncbi:MAG: hypothetical protein IPP78_02150 [Holophagaceae bacterium]|nr:hypothetical protein [Holophagaceae bacterium]
MKFNIYGRFQLDIRRENDYWVVYTLGEGKRVKASDVFIPNHLQETQIPVFLDDLFHELSGPGDRIEVVP